MADFVKFGQASESVAKAVACNINENDAAAFLALQQDVIQNAAAEARRSGATASKQNAGQKTGPGPQPGSAMAQLMAKIKK